ncbi:TIR domain-containing protein [Dactylosporangium sp. NPDC049525]|uniref:toll/interleukin-1 receptor domain-containing protein n=1 Tax=Dactylosporangium sp. NPDC049525 TaxID=3154730 RepID=UPI0034147A5F
MAGHVYIAYHPSDAGYRDRLAAQLAATGMTVWFQPPAEYGTQWLTVIRRQIDTCGVFVVLMTQRAELSDWVDQQVAHALTAGVPIMPLLLERDWTFKRLSNAGHRTFTGVSPGMLPRRPYLDDLRTALGLPPLVPPSPEPPVLQPATVIALPPSRVDTGERPNPGWEDLHSPSARLVWSPGGETIAVAGNDGTTYFWDVAVGAVRVTIEQQEEISALAWTPDSASLVTGDVDGAVRVWDAATGRQRLHISEDRQTVNVAAWSCDGALLATAVGDRSTIRLWDAATGAAVTTLNAGRHDLVGVGVWSPIEPHLLAVQDARSLRLWDTNANTVRARVSPAGHYGLAWSPDGRYLATTLDEEIIIRDAATMTEQHVLIDRKAALRCVAWAPDGKRLATGGADCSVRIWQPPHPDPILVLDGHPAAVYTVSWSPDGRRLAASGGGWTPLIWDLPAEPPTPTPRLIAQTSD